MPTVKVEGQPLGANVLRLIEALDYLGAPFPKASVEQLRLAAKQRNAELLQETVDQHVLFCVSLNPEVRVKSIAWPC